MNHYVLTVSRRDPNYPLDASRRRIALCRGITARSLAAQGTDWTWLIYIDPTDPLLDERLDAFRSAGVPVIPIEGEPEKVIDWSGPVLTTRIDDDDGLTADVFVRIRAFLRRPPLTRSAIIFPIGYRISAGKAQRTRQLRNAWSSIYAPSGDRAHIRMVKHREIADFAPVFYPDRLPAFLWVRHRDAMSGIRRARGPITDGIRRLYPVDWSLLEAAA